MLKSVFIILKKDVCKHNARSQRKEILHKSWNHLQNQNQVFTKQYINKDKRQETGRKLFETYMKQVVHNKDKQPNFKMG